MVMRKDRDCFTEVRQEEEFAMTIAIRSVFDKYDMMEKANRSEDVILSNNRACLITLLRGAKQVSLLHFRS